MLYIYLNITKNGKFELGKYITRKYPKNFADDFVKYMAKELRRQYKDAIKKQRFINRWKPLSVSYKTYKQEHHLSLNIWEATGLLLKSISYRRMSRGYIVGINPRVRYKNGLKVLDIARMMEYGTRKMPARPLFTPILNQVRKNISRYWKKFLKEEKGIVI